MLHTTVVLGPARSGKSSMIAAAIVHAARLAAEGRHIRWNGAQASLFPAGATALGGVGEYHLTEGMGTSLWRQDETTRVDTAEALDGLAQRLWLHWVLAEPSLGVSSAVAPIGAEFAVIDIDTSLLGLDRDRSPDRLHFVEVSTDLFQMLGGGKTRLRGRVGAFAEQRLQVALRHADVVCLCLGATDVWSKADLAAFSDILNDCQRLRPRSSITSIAVSKAEVSLAERAYRAGRVGFEPDALSSERYARDVIRTRFHDDGLWTQTAEAAGLRMRIVSSFGWLTTSSSFNVDLVHQSRPARPSTAPLCLRPLWPHRGKNLKHLVPSNPARLQHWRPIGVIEALLDCEVPADRRAGRRMMERS
jgi:hypothetical protein